MSVSNPRVRFLHTRTTARSTPTASIETPEESNPSLRLQNAGLVVGIVCGVASVFIAIWGIHLTNKFGENREQIDTLTSISKSQQSQIDSLGLLLDESRSQTKLTSKGIGEIQASNEKLREQAALLQTEVSILASEQKANLTIRALNRKAYYMRLKNTASFIGDLISPGRLSKNNPNPDARKTAIKDLEVLLSSELSNEYLLENQSMAKQWAEVYSRARVTEQIEFTLDENWRTDDGLNRLSTPKETIQKGKIDMFNILVDSALHLYLDVLKRIVWKQGLTGYF